jgi:hypothetical protein
MVERKPDLKLAWIGIGLAPVAAAASFQTRYMMAPFACQSGWTWSLHVVSLIALAAAGAGLFGAYRLWQLGGSDWPGDQLGSAPRNRFLGMLGMMFSALMILLILAQVVPVFFLDPCAQG